jgi:hypothetical protein
MDDDGYKKLDLIHETLDDRPGHGVEFVRHRVQLDEGVGFIPLPRRLIAPADLSFQEAQGITPPVHELEDLLHIASHLHALHHQIQNIRVGVQPAGGDLHHDIRDLPPAISVLNDLHQDASVAGGGGEVLLPLPGGVLPSPADTGPLSPGEP